MHACINAWCTHAYIHASIHASIHPPIHPYLPTYLSSYSPTYIHFKALPWCSFCCHSKVARIRSLSNQTARSGKSRKALFFAADANRASTFSPLSGCQKKTWKKVFTVFTLSLFFSVVLICFDPLRFSCRMLWPSQRPIRPRCDSGAGHSRQSWVHRTCFSHHAGVTLCCGVFKRHMSRTSQPILTHLHVYRISCISCIIYMYGFRHSHQVQSDVTRHSAWELVAEESDISLILSFRRISPTLFAFSIRVI